jgi:hypothetical protein
MKLLHDRNELLDVFYTETEKLQFFGDYEEYFNDILSMSVALFEGYVCRKM